MRTVAGNGFTFAAPEGWRLRRTSTGVTVTEGIQLLQIATFPLQRRYTDRLFAAVEPELAARLRVLAREGGGSLSPPTTVTVAGIRSHSYRIGTGGTVDQYTFVLRGSREYQLLCRRSAAAADAVCRTLLTSFRVT